MLFKDWQDRVEHLTGLSGHGSRKLIAERLSLTSETIKNAEKAGKASMKMMKALRSLEDQDRVSGFEPLQGQAGRWNIGDAVGGVLVTHVQPPFAFTASFNWPDNDLGEDWRSMRMRVVTYDEMSNDQLSELVGEARELAARRMKLID